MLTLRLRFLAQNQRQYLGHRRSVAAKRKQETSVSIAMIKWPRKLFYKTPNLGGTRSQTEKDWHLLNCSHKPPPPSAPPKARSLQIPSINVGKAVVKVNVRISVYQQDKLKVDNGVQDKDASPCLLVDSKPGPSMPFLTPEPI